MEYKLVFIDIKSKQGNVEKALLPVFKDGFEIVRMDQYGSSYCYIMRKV